MVQSVVLSKISNIVCGFSEKSDGNLSYKKSKVKRQKVEVINPILTNRKSFLRQLGITLDDVILSHQKHGDHIGLVTQAHKGLAESNESPFESADALIATEPNTYLALFTADCLPLFVADQKTNNLATIHAGWQGLAKGIIQKTIRKMQGLGSKENDLLVWIGPHIKVCHYLLDLRSSSYEKKKQAFGDQADVVARRNNQEFLDLTKVAMRQLETAGITKEQIEVSADCTACHSDRFFSYHESQGNVNGIMMGLIGRRG